jgi:hypothetical protein
VFNQQQIIQQDSFIKQTVQKDSLRDTLKKNNAVKIAPVKLSNLPIVQPEETAAFADTVPKQDTIIAEVPVVSLFTGHQLKPANQNPVEKTNFYPGWITVLLFSCILIIAYLRASYPKRFTEFFRAILDMRFASQLVREEKVLSQRVSVFLTVIFLFSASAFLFLISNYFNIQLFSGEGFVVFGKITLTIFLLFASRIIISELTGFVFNAQNEFSFYNFHVFLYNKALGLALLPILICLIYANAFPQAVFIYTGIILFAIGYVARLIRGLNIGLAKQGFNKFYLFFYFCTLEILPAAVLAKIILKHTA